MFRSRPWPTKPSIPPGSVNWYQRSLEGRSTDLVHRMSPASHCTGHIRIQRLYNAQMKSNAWRIPRDGIDQPVYPLIDHFILYTLFVLRIQWMTELLRKMITSS
ncbi:hypothetical protein Y032_0050g2016 [Ancylostoma ceylanicum]|uniref:Uncharacterized protein n=1 Tax=Ancylostoma ceylanicum TaxID=53326 RepID=A0A016UAN4_9BILA|nr:hypothetical protein Y032_0050g2016 [Ancylostoma ceylanicum]